MSDIQRWMVISDGRMYKRPEGEIVFYKDHLKAIDELKGENYELLKTDAARFDKLHDYQVQIEELKAEVEDLRSYYNYELEQNSELKAEIERLRGGWISVDDRLPEPKNTIMKCLVNVNSYGVHIDTFVKVDKAFHDYGGYVTHWQPLPQPPSEDL